MNEINIPAILYKIEVIPKERKQFARVIDTKAGRKKESIERVIRKTESMRKKKNKEGRSSTNRENKSSVQFLKFMELYAK